MVLLGGVQAGEDEAVSFSHKYGYLQQALSKPPIGHVARKPTSVTPMTLDASLRWWQDRLRAEPVRVNWRMRVGAWLRDLAEVFE